MSGGLCDPPHRLCHLGRRDARRCCARRHPARCAGGSFSRGVPVAAPPPRRRRIEQGAARVRCRRRSGMRHRFRVRARSRGNGTAVGIHRVIPGLGRHLLTNATTRVTRWPCRGPDTHRFNGRDRCFGRMGDVERFRGASAIPRPLPLRRRAHTRGSGDREPLCAVCDVRVRAHRA